MSKIPTDELAQWHDYGIYKPARIVECFGTIDEEKANQVIKNIRLLDFVSDKDILLLIKSDGGSVTHGMSIIDAIKECSSKVITHAVGPCYSMASIVFQAGDKRLISSNATLMIHLGEEGYESDHPINIDRWIEENRRMGKVADNILYKRIKEKKPRFKRKDFDELLVFDTIYKSEEIIKMGLADEVAEHKEY